MMIVIQLNSVITISVVNEQLVITNRFLGQIGNFTTSIKPVKRTKIAGAELFVITKF